MKKIVLTYGLPAGLISTMGFFLISGAASFEENFKKGMFFGFASMILGFSLIFVATKKYRDANGGILSFEKAFLIGLYITLVASTVYVVAWLIYYYNFFPDFPERYAELHLADMRANGASATEIAQESKDMAEFAVWYRNPFFSGLITYTEILPVGLLIALISAAVLKRKHQVA